ncbi:hypothetical protein Pst134EA_025680 [Puccinia striiformis f. sp. tritici]|uniref:hypothetical protein n=1 Tax=Puccinia striiformis f. sp. tritici TaxID=168172 RepID=UPI002008AFCA|nr:hypothetical protein Pst134EA_025680 [Puccinia striiformis f. sp. tritici]KAH9451741.1 hypothetical protein Pst134EA_025680 [Puccinia striiformis f. sp. tritici]
MGLLDNAKDMLSSATSNINNNYEKGSDGFSGQNDSDRSGGRNQSSGGNLNTDDSRYAKGGGGYDQSANDYNNSSSGGVGSRYDSNNNDNVGSGAGCKFELNPKERYDESPLRKSFLILLFAIFKDDQGRDNQRGSQSDSYGDSDFHQARSSTGFSGEGNNGPSDDFGARGGVSAGGVGDSRDCESNAYFASSYIHSKGKN